MEEILWCDHSNEISLAVLLHGTTCFSIFYKMEFGNFLEFLIIGTLGSERVQSHLSSGGQSLMVLAILYVMEPPQKKTEHET